jgi:hypothetical protein
MVLAVFDDMKKGIHPMSPNISAVHTNTHPVGEMPFRMNIHVSRNEDTDMFGRPSIAQNGVGEEAGIALESPFLICYTIGDN